MKRGALLMAVSWALVVAPACGDDGGSDGGGDGASPDVVEDTSPGSDDTLAGDVAPDTDQDGQVTPDAGPDGTVAPDSTASGPDGTDETDGTGGPDSDPDPMQPGTGYASDGLLIKIVAPGGGAREQVIGGNQQIRGVLFGDADALTWKVFPGGENGTIQEDTFWRTSKVPLEPGDNTVVVTAERGDTVVSDSIVLTYNPGFLFDGKPRARPNIGWVGTSQEVVFTVAASLYPNFQAGTMELVEVDEDGEELSTVGNMRDDGDVGINGDEIEGDGVFTRKAPVTCEDASPRWYRVRVQVSGGASTYTAWSPTIPVWCVPHFTPNDCDDHQAILQEAEAQYDSGESIEDVITLLEAKPAVAEAGRAEADGYSLWVRFESGILGAVLLAPEGIRGAAGDGDEGDGGYEPPDPGAFQRAAVGGNVEQLGSKKAIVLAPFASQFGVSEDGGEVASALATTECPNFNVASGAALQGGAASLERFRSLSEYGVISISSHADALFGDMDPTIKREQYRWDHVGAQEVLWSGETVQCNQLLQAQEGCTVTGSDPTGGCPAGTVCQVTEGSGGSESSGVCVDRTQVDLRLGRVVLTNRGYAMTPAFFEAWHRGRFPDSLVNLGACRTMYNGSLATAFFAAGAKAITGFSDYVDSMWARERVVEMFQGSVGKGLVGHSHTGGEDPSHPGSYWRLFGAGNLDLSNADIINASFETGDTTGWSQDGDGRVITQLGTTGPVGGKFMGLLSTGLGFTVETGTLEQDFCIPSGTNEIQLYWKFYSEEFKEFCGSPYQDTFQAVLLGGGGQLTVVDVRVDDLCPYEANTCGTCSDPVACDFECMGSSGCQHDPEAGTCTGAYGCNCGRYYVGLVPSDVDFDQGGVFNTPWQKSVKNVKALAGAGKVTLRLYASDTGDSIYDTAILVDDIKFN
ncbi:MAG: hypothetical protein ACQEXJ_08175 [Myxococcota bacterium]